MKKVVYFFMIGILMLTFGCNSNNNVINHDEDNLEENLTLEELHNKIPEIVQEVKGYNNFSGCYIDYRVDKVVVKLIDNSEEEQEWFLKNIFNSKDITFEQGGPYSTSNFELVLEEPNSTKYNKYLEKDNRTIYFAGNIKEFYVKPNQTLKTYITNTYQTFDDSIKTITEKLNKVAIIRDGGSTIYKSESHNLTMIVCNNLNGNKDIYVGDYNTSFKEFMCK